MDPVFKLGDWLVRPELNSLVRRGEEKRVPKQVMAVLVCLGDRAGEVVSKEALVEEVWEGRFVSDQAVSATIYELRKALTDDASHPRYVETIRKRGFRLLVLPETVREADPAVIQSTKAMRRLLAAGLGLLALLAGLHAWSQARAPFPPPASVAGGAEVGPEDGAPVSDQVCNAYLQGQHFLEQRTAESLRKAEAYFRDAVEIDPTFAPAHAGLADTYTQAGSSAGSAGPREAHRRALRAVSRAIEAKGGSSAESSLAAIEFRYEWNWQAAEVRFRRSVHDYLSCSAKPHQLYGEFLAAMGRHEEAIAELRQAIEMRPLSKSSRWDLAWAYYVARRYDEAETVLIKALEMDSGYVAAHELLGEIHLRLNLPEKAAEHFQRTLLLRNGDLAAASELSRALADEGVAGLIHWRISEAAARAGSAGLEPVWAAAQYASIAETEEAFEWLESAYRERNVDLVWLAVHPAFDPLRSDPRYSDLTRRIGLISIRPS